MTQDQQCAFGGEHANTKIGVFGNVLTPDPRRIHDDLRMNVILPLIFMIENAHATYPVTVAQ
ncbi:Uncharacterised protein [Yersinia enterocolitica]|nr:Uncharacterised protein [Yersinia enterocolitica]